MYFWYIMLFSIFLGDKLNQSQVLANFNSIAKLLVMEKCDRTADISTCCSLSILLSWKRHW